MSPQPPQLWKSSTSLSPHQSSPTQQTSCTRAISSTLNVSLRLPDTGSSPGSPGLHLTVCSGLSGEGTCHLSPFLGVPLYPSAAIRSPKCCHFIPWEFINCYGPQRQTQLLLSICELHESPAMFEPVEAPNFIQRTGGMIYYSFIRHSTN